ncbi:MAG: tetratricopeptide repeat protein [Acidobacteriota bacterium]
MSPRAGLLAALVGLACASPCLASGPPPRTYLILPFENVAEEPSLGWISTCIALSFGEALRDLGARVVDEEERAVLFEGSGLPPSAPLTLASSLQLGRRMRARAGEAGPDRMVLGRFLVTDGALTLEARAIDLTRESSRPWLSKEGRLKNLLRLQYGLVADLAQQDGLALPEGRRGLFDRHAADLPLLAHETYCRAMAESASRKRLRLLRRAVQEFPGYPKAVYQAVGLLVREERWDEAAALIAEIRAEPHPYGAEFHLLSAAVALERHDPDAASAAARRSLERAESARAHVLLGRALAERGDVEGARAELRAAEAMHTNDPDIADLRRLLSEKAAEQESQP